MVKFRFQDLEIWKLAIEIADQLFEFADELEKMRLYRFAEQLRGSGLSMSNNIAEGSGSSSKKVFMRYLDIAKSSTYENANMLIVLQRRGIIDESKEMNILEQLDHLSRMITKFKRSLT